MRRHTAIVLGQLGLDDVPQATGRTATAQGRHRAEEIRAAHRARERAQQWHRIAADFFQGIA